VVGTRTRDIGDAAGTVKADLHLLADEMFGDELDIGPTVSRSPSDAIHRMKEAATCRRSSSVAPARSRLSLRFLQK
jgi:hypothetical protein